MLKEEKMRKIKFIKLFSTIMCLIFTFSSYAELGVIEYFNNLTPQSHINKMYSSERRKELESNNLKYENIDDLIHLNNPDVLNNWNSWENNKSAQDIFDEYQDAANILYDAASGQESELQEGMMMAQGRAMQIQADKNSSDSYTNFLENYLFEKQLVLSTKILDINFQKSNYSLLNAREAIKEAQRQEEKAENALKYGNGTQIDLLTAKKAVIDANSALISAESSQKTYKRKLLLNCGKSKEEIDITPINIDIDFDIMKVNFHDDYQVALLNNIQYEIYRRKIENARTEEVKNEFKILYDAAPEKIFNDLENKYRNILDAIDTCNNRMVAYNLANDNFVKANNELKNGNISVKEYNTAKYNLDVANNNMIISKYDLFIAVETYNYSVKGYSDC